MINPKCQVCGGSGLIIEPLTDELVTMSPCPDQACRNGSFDVPSGDDEDFGGFVEKPKREKKKKLQPLFGE